jgi:hypothetical protein
MNDPREVECTIHHQSVAIKKAQVDARGDEAPDAIGAGDGEQPEAKDEMGDELVAAAKIVGGVK